MNIAEVMRENEKQLMELPNVVHVGLGFDNGNEIILVFVSQKLPENELTLEEIIPKQIKGFKTKVELEIKVGG